MKRFGWTVALMLIVLACTVASPTATPWPAAATGTGIPPVHYETNSVPPVVPETASVWVFFTMTSDENMTPVPAARTVPASENPAELVSSTLKELLRGPTDAEKAAGLTSWFSSATADALSQVSGAGDEYTVDFTGLNALIPNASTSAGSRMLMSQLNSTMFQFDFVQTVQYTLGGDCPAFWEWLQSGCHPVTRAEWEAG